MRIAVVWPKFFWERKMSSVRRLSLEAILRYPGASGVITGPGFDDYDTGQPLQSNIDRILPGCDMIVLYKPGGSRETPPLHGVAECKVPKCVRYNEAYWPDDKAAKEVDADRIDLVICHHENDMDRFAACVSPVNVQHNPHCADSLFHCDRPHSERKIDVLLTGVLSPEIYPLRQRFANMIKRGDIEGNVKIRKHPGYRLTGDKRAGQLMDYAQQLGDSKIALVCSSRYKYALAKYPEAALAGCCVIGDIPGERESEFREWMSWVSPTWKDEIISSYINALVRNSGECLSSALAGQALVRAQYTQLDYAKRFLDIIRRHHGQETRAT